MECPLGSLKWPAAISIVIMIVGAMCACSNGKYVDDNPVEELVEVVIKEKTGLDVDLSPKTSEDQTQTN
jgi:hypothetical protein